MKKKHVKELLYAEYDYGYEDGANEAKVDIVEWLRRVADTYIADKARTILLLADRIEDDEHKYITWTDQ